jgi:hypothetical protein
MSGVRQRIERQERAAAEAKMNGEELDYVPRATRTVREQTVSGGSVRQRLERTPDEEPAVVRPPTESAVDRQRSNLSSNGLPASPIVGGSVRQRLERERDAARPPEVDLRTGSPRELTLAEKSAAEDIRLAESRIRNAKLEAEGIARRDARWAEELRQREAKKVADAKQRDEQARLAAEQTRLAEQQRDEKAKMLVVDLMLSDASPKEVGVVKDIVARLHPADKFNPERHWLVLQKVRDAIGRQQ